jgi:hypothetical protein
MARWIATALLNPSMWYPIVTDPDFMTAARANPPTGRKRMTAVIRPGL